MTEIIVSDMPVKVNLHKIAPGADWGFGFYVMDDNCAVIDTTGWDAVLQMRDKANGKIYADLSIGSGITNTTAQGLFEFALTNSETVGFDVDKVVYDLYLTDDSSVVTCAFEGDIPVHRRVTR